MKAIINSQMTDFCLTAYYNGDFITINSDELKNRWYILFFYPNDFCFVCPTELADLASIHDELKKSGVDIYCISPDSHYAHKAWHNSSPSVNKIQFPVLSDCTGKVCKSLGLIDSELNIIRSTFLINPEGKVKLAEYYENGIGRDSGELLRKVKLIVNT